MAAFVNEQSDKIQIQAQRGAAEPPGARFRDRHAIRPYSSMLKYCSIALRVVARHGHVLRYARIDPVQSMAGRSLHHVKLGLCLHTQSYGQIVADTRIRYEVMSTRTDHRTRCAVGRLS